MIPKLKIQLVVLILLFSGVIVAFAGSPHFIGTLGFSAGSFHMNGDIAGLGNQQVTVRLDAYAKVTPLCKNSWGSTAPGRYPLSVTESASQASSHNGRSSFNIVVPDPLKAYPLPSLPSAHDAGCSYGEWSVVGFVPHSTRWTGAKVSVFDTASGTLLIQQNYTCTGVDDGLTCTQT